MTAKAPRKAIDAEEALLGVSLPGGLRERLLSANGGDLWIGSQRWTLYPVMDPTTRRTSGQTAGHIARQTAALRDAFGELYPSGAIAVGEDAAGTPLLLLPNVSSPAAWHLDTGDLEPLEVDWARKRAPRKRPTQVTSAWIARSLGASRGLDEGICIEAAGTPYAVTFTFRADGIDAAATGLGRLPKVQAYHIGEPMIRELSALGWRPPTDRDEGDWLRHWAWPHWDPDTVAELVVSTFERAYGLEARYLRQGRSERFATR